MNTLFLEAILALSATDSAVWVHDYQLMLLPALIRHERPLANIGFFLHIPFPALDNFIKLEHGGDLISGLLGSDLMGLHVQSYMRNFLDAVQHFGMGDADMENSRITLSDRVVQVAEFPIGIDYKRYLQASKDPAVQNELFKLRQKYEGLKVILTVDRLDPSKGLVERALAYQTLLQVIRVKTSAYDLNLDAFQSYEFCVRETHYWALYVVLRVILSSIFLSVSCVRNRMTVGYWILTMRHRLPRRLAERELSFQQYVNRNQDFTLRMSSRVASEYFVINGIFRNIQFCASALFVGQQFVAGLFVVAPPWFGIYVEMIN